MSTTNPRMSLRLPSNTLNGINPSLSPFWINGEPEHLYTIRFADALRTANSTTGWHHRQTAISCPIYTELLANVHVSLLSHTLARQGVHSYFYSSLLLFLLYSSFFVSLFFLAILHIVVSVHGANFEDASTFFLKV